MVSDEPADSSASLRLSKALRTRAATSVSDTGCPGSGGHRRHRRRDRSVRERTAHHHRGPSPERRDRDGEPLQPTRSGAQRRGHLSRDPEIEGLEPWAKHARVELGQEQRHSAPEGRQGVAELARHRAQKAFAYQPTQVVPHLARRILLGRHAEQLSDGRPEPSIGDPLGRRDEQTQGAEQARHPRLAELQGGGGLLGGRPRGEDQLGELRRG